MGFEGVQSSPVSPRDWGLAPAPESPSARFERMVGETAAAVTERCNHTVDDWLPRHWNEEAGAFNGYYDPRTKHFDPPQLVNLIAPWLLIATYDRREETELLDRAARAAQWLDRSGLVITHPMSLALGGVREPGRAEAWTKYTAEYVLLNLALECRVTDGAEYLYRAVQSGRFLVQAIRHGLAVRYLEDESRWETRGWQAFGRVIEALLSLYGRTRSEQWRSRALEAADVALGIQHPDGCFSLINGEYYNSDLAADPIRGLINAWQVSGDAHYLDAARSFADWHLSSQTAEGAWMMTIDCEGNVVCPTVGPGDVPNIGISLLLLHAETGEERYLDAAARAFRYTLSVQVTPEDGARYSDDPAVRWGFWSWMPHYDFTVSADQATHHVRGLYFLLDYLATLDEPQT